jgi:hypothetical protein
MKTSFERDRKRDKKRNKKKHGMRGGKGWIGAVHNSKKRRQK